MSAMKRWLEDVSENMGLGGAITDRVITEAQRRLEKDSKSLRKPSPPSSPCRTGKSAAQLLREIPIIDGKRPKGLLRDDGVLQLSAEEGDGFLDYYGEFKGGYPYIHPKLEEWAEAEDCFFEWDNPGAVTMHSDAW